MLVDAAEGEWKTLILLAYFTGARLGDCCRMEWEAVDLAKCVLTYTQGKTGKPVTTPLHPDLEAQLSKLAACDRPERFIMPGMADKARWTPRAFRELQSDYAQGGRGLAAGKA